MLFVVAIILLSVTAFPGMAGFFSLNKGLLIMLRASRALPPRRGELVQDAEEILAHIGQEDTTMQCHVLEMQALGMLLDQSPREALTFLLRMPEDCSCNQPRNYLLGESYGLIGDLSSAFSYWQAAGAVERLKVSGQDLAIQRDWKNSALAFRSALELTPDDADLHIGLGNALWSASRDPQAENEFKMALAAAPGDIRPYLALGSLNKDLGRLDQAGMWYQRARQVHASSELPLVSIGHLYLQQGRLDEAEQVFQEAVRLAPTSANAHAGLGLLYCRRHLLGEAMREFQYAVGLLPDEAWMHQALGDVYRDLGYQEDARREYELCLDLPGGDDSYVQWELEKLSNEH